MPTIHASHAYVGIDRDGLVVLVGADIPDEDLARDVRDVLSRGGHVIRMPLERSRLFAAHLYQVAPPALVEGL